MYRNALSEYLQTFPSYLGGDCACSRCEKLGNPHMQLPEFNEQFTANRALDANTENTERFSPNYKFPDVNEGCEWVLRSAVVGILMVWVLIALIAGLVDPESRPTLPH